MFFILSGCINYHATITIPETTSSENSQHPTHPNVATTAIATVMTDDAMQTAMAAQGHEGNCKILAKQARTPSDF
jgi:hypothetical protein